LKADPKGATDAMGSVRDALALGGGGVKRVDENRELLELLLTDAPGVLCRHPWVIDWLKTNDQVFSALHDALAATGMEKDRRMAGFPRPWPQDRLDALNAWSQFGSPPRTEKTP
jgi:hypothetical protein